MSITDTTPVTTTTARLDHIQPPGVVEIPGISHVVVSRRTTTVHVGGQVPLDAAGDLVGEDFDTQVRQVLHNLQACLDAAGATAADLVRLRAFVVGCTPERVAQLETAAVEILSDWVGPTATLIGVDALFLPGQLVEIDAEAAIA